MEEKRGLTSTTKSVRLKIDFSKGITKIIKAKILKEKSLLLPGVDTLPGYSSKQVVPTGNPI